MSKTSIIIHGHFYQPPRENPYTGIVPIQDSAKPYDNWNEAIYKTCYKPNSESRYLSCNGQVSHIYNNYASLSVNMGQTLLDYLDENHPDFVQRLYEADRMSIDMTGHSAFMAQGFNHTIMPLDSLDTKRVQTVWAIESYRARFGHDPEGFWLAECAINAETVDILAENGIRYVVLAPWQAVAIDGVPTNGRPMPCDRPFLIKGANGGTISAFFYNGEFASGVSFGHMLRDADLMFSRLCRVRSEMGDPALISWATDGEIYGHHEPFGDMGLAALIRKINSSEDFQMDNFGSFLARHPATEVATLGGGDDGKGTSWSCMHGVGRWERDCGCRTGGDESWNQRWRGPLRKAFNNLETSGRAVIDRKVREILGKDADYKALTLSYKAVVAHRTDVQGFTDSLVKQNGRKLSQKEKTVIASLLEAFKNIMFSYTSCGWFFNDLAGIEPVQNINYSVYAAKILDQFTDEDLCGKLLKDLSLAHSNIIGEGSGSDLARCNIPSKANYMKACSFIATNHRFAVKESWISSWGFLRLERYSDSEMTIFNTRTLERHHLSYESIPYANGQMGFAIKDIDTGETTKTNILKASAWSKRRNTQWVEERLSAGFPEAMIDTIAENIGNYLMLVSTDRSLFKETIFTENIGTCIKAIKSLIMDQPEMSDEKRITRIAQLSEFVRIKGRPTDIQDIKDTFTRKLNSYALALAKNLDEKTVRSALNLLRASRSQGFDADITDFQDAAYLYLNKPCDLPRDLCDSLFAELNFVTEAAGQLC